ncbi:MAG: rhomboid family intramembrane serine protease [Oligoflexia bacterium]|nr:rhomboid family intramembrane serine protease [Oligoflexia bacterium]MBF0367593.1 rhomboid family intramembrane serine protease [Oligoflexia bacterium]
MITRILVANLSPMSGIEKWLISNYLSHEHYRYGKFYSLGFVVICLLMSGHFWASYGNIGTEDFLLASPYKVFVQKKWWCLLTTALIHADLGHLLSNAFMLVIMGRFVSSYYGFWVHPVLSLLLGGGVCNLLVLGTLEEKVALLGASGVVYYLWGIWQVLYLLIQRHISLNRRFMKITAVNLFLLLPSYFDPRVSYLAHLLGFLLGVLSGAVLFLFKKRFYFSYEVFYESNEDAQPTEFIQSPRRIEE